VKDSRHVLGTTWREADAAALNERVRTIDEWLEHTEDIIEMLENDEKVITELRGVTGRLRTKRADVLHDAEVLEARLADRHRNRGV
jgi:hypothetical protein